MTHWRLIITPPLSASSNMAIDEAILNIGSRPTLRFYGWKDPSVTIGRLQYLNDKLLNSCTRLGVPVVRRPTGGRAILHHFEITYSLISPYELFPGPTTLAGIYEKLAQWQVESLNALGVKACMGDRRGFDRAYQKSESCFMTSTPYEIHVGGKKISGSAQRRCRNAFLQHGSILIQVDTSLMQKLLGNDGFHPETFTTLGKEGYKGSRDEVIEIMSEKFSHIAKCSLHEENLSSEEHVAADRLIKDQYADLAVNR